MTIDKAFEMILKIKHTVFSYFKTYVQYIFDTAAIKNLRKTHKLQRLLIIL